jgi:sigma-B regulation protein RsbU (phosphoserine phosphatase)
MPSVAEIRVLLRADVEHIAFGMLVIAIALVSLLVAVARRIRAGVVGAFALYSLLYGSWLLLRIPTFEFILGLRPSVAARIAAVIFYFMPAAGVYLWSFFAGSWGRKVLLGLAAIHAFVALIGVATDVYTGQPLSLGPAHHVLVLAGALVSIAVLAANAGPYFFRLGWAGRSAAIGSGILLATVVYDHLAELGLWRYISSETIGFTAFLFGMGWAVEYRVLADEGRLMALRSEMEQARRIQQSILPAAPPQDTPFHIAATYSPMTAVAGDLYDFLSLEGGRLGIFVADVSGHGVPAALVASMVKTALNILCRSCSTPGKLLQELNRVFYGQFQEQFITAACAVLDARLQTVTYSAAGHPPLLLWSPNVAEVVQIVQNGLPLGIGASADYTDVTVPFTPGDRLALYTDGVVETENSSQEEFGLDRLGAILATPKAGAEQLVAAALSSIDNWRGPKQEQADDVTLVIVEYAAAQGSQAASLDASAARA